MPAGDNDITITIRAVDASGPAIQQTVGRLDELKLATERYNSAQAELGKSAAAGNAEAARIIQQYKVELEQAGAAGARGGEQIATGMGGAYGQMRLVSGLGREMGLNIDYGLRRVLATMPGVTSALSSLLPLFGAIGVVALLAPAVEGAVHLAEKYSDLDEAVDNYIEKAREAASEKLVGGDSIETTTAALQSIGTELDELDKKRAHFFEQWRIDGTNIQLPGAGLFQYLIPTSDIWDKGDDARAAHLSELQAKGIKALQEQTAKLGDTQLRSQQQYDDLTDKGYVKVAAHLRDEINLIHARNEAQRAGLEQAQRAAGQEPTVRTDLSRFVHAGTSGGFGTDPTYSAKEAAEIAAAQKEASGQRIALGRTESTELIHLDNEAMNAKLAGISLLRAQEEQAIAEVRRKYSEMGAGQQAVDRAVADTRAKYDGEVMKALDEQAAKLEQMQHEAESAGLTGIAKVQSDADYQQQQANKGSDRDWDLGSEWNRQQQRVLLGEKADAEILGEQRQFSEEMAQITEHNADRVLSGYAKIEAETRQSLGNIAKDFEKTFGQLNLFDPSQLATFVAGVQQAQAGVDAVLQNSARERQKYSEQVDRQITATENEAARQLLPPWEQAQQKIVDDYNQRLQKVRDDANQHVITEQQAAHEVQAAWDLANAEMERSAEQARDQLAGKLSSLFDNPEKFLKERAKQMMLDIVANWVTTLENANGPIGGVLRGILGQGGEVGTQNNPLGALGKIFGVGGHQHSGVGGDAFGGAGSTLTSAGVALHSSGTILAGAGSQLISAAQALQSIGAGGGVGGAPSAGQIQQADTIGSSSTNDEVDAGVGGGGGLLGSGINTGGVGGGVGVAFGGIGQAASVASGIGGATGLGSVAGVLGTAGGVAGTAGQIAQMSGLLGSTAGTTAPLLNPNATGGPFPGAQPTDINTPPTIDANGNLVPQAAPDAGGSLSASQGIGIAGAGLSTALGLASAWQSGNTGQAVLTGALGGASIGMLAGGPIGAAIGAGVGALVGFVGSLFGDHGASKARNYNIQQVIPQLQQMMNGFSGGQSDYDQSSLAINNLQIQAQKQCYQWGSGAIDVYKNTIVPEITNAQNQVNREGAAGRSNVTFSAAQFHGGGDITDFGDLWTSNTTGFIHAELGERMLSRMEVAASQPRETGAAHSYVRGSAGVMGGGGSGGGENHVHVHIHAIDVQDFSRFLRNGGAMVIQEHVNNNTGRYSGRALSPRG